MKPPDEKRLVLQTIKRTLELIRILSEDRYLTIQAKALESISIPEFR